MYKNIEFFKSMQNKNKTINEVANICNVNRKTINNWEKKHGIKLKREDNPHRKWTLNEDYFSVIDNEYKAYFLGLLMADGYIDKKLKTMSIALKNEDSKILELLLKHIGSNQPLRNKKNNTQKVIYFSSKKLVLDLMNYRITNNKTSSVQFPKLDSKLMKHFIRGYFDGDGYIGPRQCTLIIASNDFLRDFLEYFKLIFNKELYHHKAGKVYRINFNKRDKEIINYIYKNANIGIERKRKSFEKYWSTL